MVAADTKLLGRSGGSSVYQTAASIVAEGGGPFSLWRGWSASVLRVGMGAAIHFFTLELMREAAGTGGVRRVQSPARANDGAGWLTDAAMGGGARSIAVVLMCPVTTVKTRMEASGEAGSRYVYRNVPQALAAIARTEGILSLWRGLTPNLAANAPFSAIHYMCYRKIQAAATPYLSSPTATSFLAGALASTVATLITQPLDVLRTRAMLRIGPPAGGGSSLALFAGIGPRLAKRAIQTTLVWTFYEEIYSRWQRLAHRTPPAATA